MICGMSESFKAHVDSCFTAILDCTIPVQNRSYYLPKSANLNTDLQFID